MCEKVATSCTRYKQRWLEASGDIGVGFGLHVRLHVYQNTRAVKAGIMKAKGRIFLKDQAGDVDV